MCVRCSCMGVPVSVCPASGRMPVIARQPYPPSLCCPHSPLPTFVVPQPEFLRRWFEAVPLLKARTPVSTGDVAATWDNFYLAACHAAGGSVDSLQRFFGTLRWPVSEGLVDLAGALASAPWATAVGGGGFGVAEGLAETRASEPSSAPLHIEAVRNYR